MKNDGKLVNSVDFADEVEKITMQLDGLKELQGKVGFEITECMERITRIERYFGFGKRL